MVSAASLDTSDVTFGNVQIGTESKSEVTIHNTGPVPLKIYGASTPDGSPFTSKFASELQAPGFGFVNIPLSVRSLSAGDFTSDLTIRTNATGSETVVVHLHVHVPIGLPGDFDQSGSVNLTDIVAVHNAATLFTTGYVKTDVTGNNVVNLNDIVLTYNNSTAFVVKMRP